MENTIGERLPNKALPQQDLMAFFITHLNRIYCAKSQLVEKLPELAKRSHFLDLKQAIDETVEIVDNQIKRMKEIFIMLDSFYTYEACTGLIGILDEAFQSIGPKAGNATLRDLSILFYMQNIESIEMASFKMLMMVADKIGKPEVLQLLTECYDEAKDDRVLLKQISQNYIW
jgi:ferritin-like metal-binding protein YciE